MEPQTMLEFSEVMRKKLKTIDLFAGIGGLRLGFQNHGFETVFANDYESKCKDTYDLNFSNTRLTVGDIREISSEDIPDFDFLLAGFPCQAFSVAGYRQGFDDEKGRGNLFFEIARILEDKKPIGFLLENVKNLRGHDGGKTFRVIMKTLRNLGYDVTSQVLNSMNYGNVPQNRERIYIVGFLRKTGLMQNFNFPQPQVLSKSIIDILEDPTKIDQKYYYNDKPLFDHLKKYSFKENRVYQWRRQYVRENKSGVCPTLTANMGTGGHNVPIVIDKRGIRKLTPKECLLVQGFPKDYKLPEITDSHLYKQIGNSVTVPVVEMMAEQISEIIFSPKAIKNKTGSYQLVLVN